MFSFLKKIIELPTPSYRQDHCQACIQACIDYLGHKDYLFIKKHLSNHINSCLISNTKDTNLDLLFLCHIDVVDAPKSLFTLQEKNNIFYGRGVFDMKGPTVCVLEALKNYFSKNNHKKIGLLLVSDEEVGGENGTKYWSSILSPKVVIEPDSAQPIDKIIESAKQPFFVKLISSGISAHGSRPWLGIDAIQELLSSIQYIQEKGNFQYYSQDNLPLNQGWVHTMHIGKIQGGTSMNAIADTAEATLDFRFIDSQKIDEVKAILKNLPSSNVQYEVISQGILVKTDLSHPIVQTYKNITESVIGIPLLPSKAFGATDGRYFSHKSTLITHQATGGDAHGDNEWVSKESLLDLTQIYHNFLNYFETF